MAHYFGVRHFSPACAFYVREFLDRVKPKLVLIEGPSDLSGLIGQLCAEEAVLPAAILAYTEQPPIRTVLYPFAEFSPEYQAILWAGENGVEVRFCDLPSGCALAYYSHKDEAENEPDPQERESVYQRIEQMTGLDNDTFWEYNFEQAGSLDELLEAVREYGRGLREFSPEDEHNALREAYMRRVIHEAEQEIPTDKIAVVTGAFHSGGLDGVEYSPEDEKLTENIPTVNSLSTLMPYSYYRLSSRSGYGAGSKAPGFYEILWNNRLAGKQQSAAEYLSRIAEGQRMRGFSASSAEVIEALRLANTLAEMRGGRQPSLSDLRDAAVTCMGHGTFGEISVSCADVEIGTKIGSLPEGSVSTSVQQDFMRQLGELNLERFRTAAAEELKLDLRENLRVKSEKSAFLDLNRSFFLHRLRVLDIGFGTLRSNSGDNEHTEIWELRWSPECEIRLVESSLLGGDTIEQACAMKLTESLYAAQSLPEAAKILADAFLCGIIGAVKTAVLAVQRLAADCVSAADCGGTIGTLSAIVRFGSIRRLDTEPLSELMKQLYLRFCLSLPLEWTCDENAAHELMKAISRTNDAVMSHDFLDEERFLSLLLELSDSDMASPLLSGFGCAVLTDRGKISSEKLSELISRRLSKGTPPAEGALWFEGLAQKNRRALIARLSIWEKLCSFIAELSDEEFKPTLVCLRRTFAEFSPSEKADIAENIGEALGISVQAAAEMISAPITAEEQQTINELDDFDFGDI